MNTYLSLGLIPSRSWRHVISLVIMLATIFVAVPPVSAQPRAQTDASARVVRGADRRGATVTLGVFGGLIGTYGLIGLGAGFPLLYQERQSRSESIDGGVGCGSCIALTFGSACTLAATWMFVRVGRRTHAYRTLGLGHGEALAVPTRRLVLPSFAFDGGGRSFRLALVAAF